MAAPCASQSPLVIHRPEVLPHDGGSSSNSPQLSGHPPQSCHELYTAAAVSVLSTLVIGVHLGFGRYPVAVALVIPLTHAHGFVHLDST